ANDDRDLLQAGAPRRVPAALAGDDLIGVAARGIGRAWSYDDRLQDPLLADRVGELLEPVLGQMTPRLISAGRERVDRHLDRLGRRSRRRAEPRVREQRFESILERHVASVSG